MRPRTSHYAPDTLDRPPHWGDDAACKSSKTPDQWFADGDDVEAVADREEAKKVCGQCPARTDCLHGALERGEPSGVWGGLDANERTSLALYRPAPARTPAPNQEAADGRPQPTTEQEARTA